MKARAIRAWMRLHVSEYVDRCNEVNYTGLVEAWDQDQGDGSTTDPDHDAWTIAVEVAEEFEKADAKKTGIHGWPLVPSKRFPGETTLACPRCGSTDITHGIRPGACGTAPGGRWRMGDVGGGSFIRCESCGKKDID